jgi:hypothetical protein
MRPSKEALLAHPASEQHPKLRRAFELRCWARAHLWWEHVYTLHESVDVLQRDAESSGLVEEIGQDEVQRIMSAAFGLRLPRLP